METVQGDYVDELSGIVLLLLALMKCAEFHNAQ
jgi:hypothetical protein